LFISYFSQTVQASYSNQEAVLKKGIYLTLSMKTDSAIIHFDRLISEDPQNPAGYFFKSAVYFWLFSENIKDENIASLFEETSFKAVEAAEQILDEDDENKDALFYLGGAYGNLGRL